jgi:RNase adaptor protein for sRNA GlmZ degradation
MCSNSFRIRKSKTELTSRKPTDWQGLIDVVKLNAEEDLLIERHQTNTRRDPFENDQK